MMHSVLANPLAPGRWPRPLQAAGRPLMWLALVLIFHTRAQVPMTPTLDSSNYGSYAYYTAHGFQYGTEVVPMAGPYGFIMYGWTYGGDLSGLRLAGELALNGVLAALTMWFFAAMRGSWLRWVWLAAHILFTPIVSDLPLEWILLLGGLYLLSGRPGARPGWRDYVVVAALALVSLIKGTQLVLGFATLGVVLGGRVWQREGRQALRLGAGFAVALLAWWLLAGQNPLHLPAYVRGILELGGGYTDAMSIPTPPDIFERSLLISTALAAGLGLALWHRRTEPAAVAALLLLAGHSFVQWKHAIVRADGHAQIYACYAAVAGFAISLVGTRLAAGRPGELFAWRSAGLAIVTLLLSRAGYVSNVLAHGADLPRLPVDRMVENADYFAHLHRNRAGLEQALQRERDTHSLPAIREQIGNRPVDAFGFEQGLVILNRFNYRPRPVGGGSFNVYTPYLMDLNRAFLRDDARRPDFYLFKPETIDDRWFTPDDGRALVEIVQRYHPVLLEHEHLLLAATAGAPGPEPRLLARTSFRFGQKVKVPAVDADQLLLLRLEVNPNWEGRIRSALYKLPPVFLEALDDEGVSLRRGRIVPGMVASPFLLSPLVETREDFIDLYAAGAGRTMAQFRLDGPDLFPFAPIIEAEFFTVPRPVLEPAALAQVRGRLRFPYANVEPESITPAFRAHLTVRYLHAPSEAVWALTGQERALSFHYGIDAEAYEKGTTNGVVFIVELRGPSGAVREIFRRSLRPREVAADRGEHEARVTLPIYAAGSRLVLRTDPGEFGDNSWDWAYASLINLQRGGAYAAELFPGFNRLPDAAEDENAAALDLDGRRVLLLHLPGAVRFNLTGRENRLALDFGFLPGAYTNGGQTTGGEYIVEITRAGQPAREILRRRLQPVTEPADRGPQTATVDLTGIAAGDVLTVRTAPVPGGTTSWGWTYLSRLVIE